VVKMVKEKYSWNKGWSGSDDDALDICCDSLKRAFREVKPCWIQKTSGTEVPERRKKLIEDESSFDYRQGPPLFSEIDGSYFYNWSKKYMK
jgi:hypothetical protein